VSRASPWVRICSPNWSVELFIKEPGDGSVVSWHQDITYWGMGETDEEVTAWLALSDVSVEAGCMRFIPGSHKNGIVAHHDTFDETNLLSRGQEIADIDETLAEHGPLKPAEMSLHQRCCFHASAPNGSDGQADRRRDPVRHARGAPGRHGARLCHSRAGARTPAQGWINVAAPSGTVRRKRDWRLYEEVLMAQSAVPCRPARKRQGGSMYRTGERTEGRT
jgi:ectoine hydroxylase-related dioxygenase (phytanoyl-CoA dioxygenase family)